MAVVANITVNRIIVEEFFAFDTLRVVIIAARIANVDVVAVRINSKRNFIGEEIFVALIAQQVLVGKTAGTNIGAVVNQGHLTFVVVFLAMFAEAIILVQAMVADLDTFAVTINDFPSLGAVVFTLLTQFAAIVIAIVTEKFVRKFASAGNAKSVSPDIENLVVMLMVSANGNFSVEVWMNPITITAKAITAGDMNTMFITAIFFSLPEIRNTFKLGEFALNQIAIKL